MSPVLPTRMRRAVLGAAGVLAFVLLWKVAGIFGWVQRGTMPDQWLVPRGRLG